MADKAGKMKKARKICATRYKHIICKLYPYVFMSSGIKWALSSCTNILCVYSVLVYSGF